jgi:hypothetical protein
MIASQLYKVRFVLAISIWWTSILGVGAVAQTTIHVPADVPSIPQAINQAQNGDTILVSPGTYVGNFTFQGKAITVASTDGPSVTILDAQNVSSGPLFLNGEGPQSVLSGFTITNGFSGGEGAGVFISGASPTIQNNIITGNHGCEGIGITADNSSAIIKNNVITNNTPAGCWGLGGGGIKISGAGNAQILNNTITGNTVWGHGGGIEINGTTLVTIQGNTIQNNSANTNNGGGISVENGSQANIVNNLITSNTGFLGSGIYLISTFGNQNVLVNNTIAFNVLPQGFANGQEVWMSGFQTGTQFANNVVVDGTGSGAVGCDPSFPSTPNFVANDVLSTQPTTPPQPAPSFSGCQDPTGTNGNISADPQFVNAAGNDFHLQSTSPAIDVGSNTAPDLPSKDLDGNARIGPGNASTCAGTVDMGAYEFALNSSGTAFFFGGLDFGTIVVGASSSPQSANFFIQGCVQVASITTTGDFSQTNTCGHALSSPNCSIQVVFTPTTGGQRTGTLKMDFGSSASAISMNLSGTGLVVPPAASPTSLTFGAQIVGTTSASQTVTVSAGGGTTSLQITSVSITGDYAQTNSCVGLPVAAPTCFVNVSFGPSAVGSRPGSMVINTNQGSFNISLGGTGINPIGQLSPSSLNFGNQLLTTSSAPQAVTLTNTGVGTLQISGFGVNGDFSLSNNCGSSLAQGASCTINVIFTPAAVGSRSGGFTVNTNNGNPGVALSGTGVVPVATFAPSALTFAGQLLNSTSSAQAVTLSNTGGAPLVISSITASGDFAQTNTCGTSVAPGGSCTINVTFTPVARGTRSGTLTLNSNTFGSEPTVSLSGTGQAIVVTASPTSLIFPLTAVNTTSAAQPVTLTNSGDLAVTLSGITISGDYAETDNCGTSLDVGASCTINVTFTPSIGGADDETLRVNGSFGNPVVVALNGLGQTQGAAGTLTPAYLIFTNQAAGTTSAAQTLTYTNTGTVAVSINDVKVGFGPFALITNCPASLNPGASCTINVNFTPPDTTGQAGVINVDGTGSALALLAGSSLQQLDSPTNLNFSRRAVNSTSPIQTVTFTNTTGNSVNISGVSWPLPFNVVNHCTGTISAGASCSFDATFAPTSAGSFSGFFEITGNFAGSPAVLPITGSASGPAASLSPASLVFASQGINTSSTSMQATLTNNGSVPLGISSFQTSGDFAQTNNCPATLAPAASCAVNVVFTPTAVGVRTGSLSVATNPAVSIAPVALSGTGVTSAIAVFSPQSLNFGSVGVGTTTTQTVTLTNSGTAALSFSLLPTGDFSVSTNCGNSLAPGASCPLTVGFRPSAMGNRTGSLSLTADNSTPQPPAVILSGTGTAAIGNFSSTSLTFAPQLVGTTSAAQSVTLTNSGNVALSIGNLIFFQPGAPYFSQTNNCGSSLAAGASCSVNVVFSPQIRGSVQAGLQLNSNSIPVVPSVTVSGTGQVIQGSVSPATINFGSQSVNTTSAAQSVTLTNNGDLALLVTGVASTGDFAQTNTCGASLAVGANCTVAVTFAPTATGSRSGTLNFNSNATTPISPVNLSGSGTLPAPSLSPSSLSFSPQVIGTSSGAQTLVLTNSGAAAISITAINPLPANSDFSQTNNCGASLAAGASCTVNVTFTPIARGSRTGQLSVAGNFVGNVVNASLSGTGQAILATVSPASLTFAAAPLNTTSSAQAVTFTNSGDTAATITGVATTGDFAQTNNCGTSLAAGASCSVNVTFTPTARGSRTGTVTLQGNFTSAAPVVNLSGSGQASLATLTPASFDFGNEPVNTTTNPQSFTYTNTGDLPLTISGVAVTPDFNQTNNCPASLAVNASCTITVTFVPRSTGTQTASLTVSGTVNSSSSVTGTGVMPLATLSPATLSFGNQRSGTLSTPQLVTVTNSGAFPFFVNGVSWSGPYQVTNNCSGVIAVGGSCTVSVVFAPTSSQAGPFPALLTITGDFTATPASVNLSGTAMMSAGSLSPTTVTFASQNVGTTSAAQTLTLTNTGNAAINLSGIQATGDFAQTNNCGASVAVGSSCSIAVTFTPTAHGARNGTITVSGDFTGAAPSATLSGNGTTPTASWSPASLSYGNQLVGSASSSQGVTLTNNGDGPLTITAITTTGDFAQTNNCGSALNPAASCTIAVTFTPSATGNRSGTLSLTSNSSVNPISLSGTGIAPAANLQPAILAFANQLLNTTSATQTATLTNTGTATLNIKSIAATGDFSETTTCGSTLAAGANCTVTVSFLPTATGTRTGVLTITDDQIAGGQQTSNLTGTGIAPAASLSPTSLVFANQLVNSSSANQVVTLTNTGTATLNIKSIAATGDFSALPTCNNTLAAGASCTISVAFTPTATGTRTGVLTITDDQLAGGQQTVNLSGAGIAPAASLSPASLAFGNQVVNTSSAASSVTLTNSGTATLTVSNINVSGETDFSETNNCSSLAPGASCIINVIFTPTGPGARNASLNIIDDQLAGGQQTVSLTGTGTLSNPAFTPATMSFGNQLVNTSSTSPTVLKNLGTATLNISSISASGDFTQTNNCGSTLAPSASCTINVTFTPTVTGNRSGTLTVNDDSFFGSPQTVPLSGTGVVPAASLSPTSLTFGNQLVNTASQSPQITLTNTGSATLNISSITVTGDFSQTNNCGSTLAAGSNCAILVTFKPTAMGTRNGTLTINDDPLAGGQQTVPLSGTGVAPVAAFSPGSVSFSNQMVNSSSASQSVTLSNTGTATLTINSIGVTGDFSQTNNCGSGLVAGTNCTINVTFTPTATGTRTGSLTLSSNSNNTVSPVTLSGTGIAPAAAVSPASLSFADQVVNSSSASQTVTLSNNGTAPLTINGISTTGDFSQTNNCSTTLAAGGSCTINVIFTPTATGARSGSLTITDNALAGSPQTVSLSGTGIDFSLSASPSSVTVSAGQTAHYTVTVIPLGGSFGSAVSLSCSGLPTLSACSFNPAAPTPGASSVTSTLNLTTTSRHNHAGTPAGHYTITITGTSGGRVQTVTVQLVVN